MDLNSYIWLLAPKCRKALVVLTKYAVYFLCLILLCDYVDKLSAFYNGDVYLGKDGNYYFYTPVAIFLTRIIKITITLNIFLLILGIALRFCWRYLLGVLYIFAVLIQREYLDTIFTSNSAFLTICYTNIAVILVILFLGIQQFFRNIKSGQH